MKSLYEIAILARLRYDNRGEFDSPYICDHITSVEDDFRVTGDFNYNVTRPLLDFIKDETGHKYSALEYLFPGLSGHHKLNDDQLKQLLEFREQLWEKLFDYAKGEEP